MFKYLTNEIAWRQAVLLLGGGTLLHTALTYTKDEAAKFVFIIIGGIMVGLGLLMPIIEE